MAPTQQDALTKKSDIPVKLPVFEGPLDLLLYLIKRNEVDIYDIPIVLITQQYLNHIKRLEQLNLELAGDFVVMAATLMYIKSRMLLPAHEQLNSEDLEDEEAIDPRWELVQQLIEYKRFKQASKTLQQKIDYQQDFLPLLRKLHQEAIDTPPTLIQKDQIELWNAFNLVMRRLADKITVGEIHDENYTIAERMEAILQKLKESASFLFSDLFECNQVENTKYSINYIVATFLAMLELARLKKLKIQQDNAFEDILCSALETN